MKFGFIPLSVEVPSTDACLSHYWKLLFLSEEIFFFARLHFAVPMLSILSPDAFRSLLLWTLNGANNPIGPNTKDTSDRILLWVLGAPPSLFIPLHTWRLSSVLVHFSPSTEDPSVLGSTSTCFVLLNDFKLSGIASVTASLLLIHFFSSNPCCERRGCSWLKTSIASSGVSTDFDELLHVGVVLCCLCCNRILFFVVQSQSFESIVCTSWKTLSSKHVTLIFVYLIGSLVLGRHKNLKQLLSCSGTCTCRNFDSMSAVRIFAPSRNLNIVPINSCSRSGPDSNFSNLSFRHTSLYFDAALQTRLT